MRFFRIFLIILMVAVYGGIFANEPLPGSQFGYIGSGVVEFSLANTGIAELGSMGGVGLNPAKLADIRRGTIGLSVLGLGSDFFLMDLGGALPTLAGVFSLNARYLAGPESSDSLGQLIGADISMAKDITDNLFWGFALKFSHVKGLVDNVSDWVLGFDMGFIVNNPTPDAYGFGLFDFSYGAVLKNIGKTATLGEYNSLPALGLGIGASSSIIKTPVYEMRLLADINVPFNPVGFVGGIGMENTVFNLISIRGGVSYNTAGMPFWYAGGGLKFAFVPVPDKPDSSTDVEISYSIQNLDFNGKNSIAHSVNLSVAVGYYDRIPPEVSVSPNYSHFSPNFTGSQDEVNFYLDIRDNTMVKEWELIITDKDGEIVKTFHSTEALRIRNLTIPLFVRRIFSKRTEVFIPEYITWNGFDKDGKVVEDGDYFYVLRAWDDNDNLSETKSGIIVVDTVIPVIEAEAQYLIFSPNNDGVKDENVFSVSSENITRGTKITAEILDTDGKTRRTFRYEDTSPEQIVWDGLDDRQIPVGEGIYDFRITARDLAGNQTSDRIRSIRLVTNYQNVTLSVNRNGFSPGGATDTVTFSPSVDDDRGLENWVFRIYDNSTNVVREFKGTDKLPAQIVWNGNDAEGKRLSDGDYLYDIQLFYDSGNYPKTQLKTITIDTTPTQIEIDAEYLAFSPNRDGVQDDITFVHRLSGRADDMITSKILYKKTGEMIYFDRSPLSEFPQSFTWDGFDKRTSPPYRNFPQGEYLYVVEAVDWVGNRNSREVEFFIRTGRDEATVSSDVLAISPGTENANQKIKFDISLTFTERIEKLILEIRNADDKPVRRFVTNAFVPQFVWEGKDDAGKNLPDGIYFYDVSVEYDYGGNPRSDTRTVRIDRVPPNVGFEFAYMAFSPNDDGRQDYLPIRIVGERKNDEIFTASFARETEDGDRVVRTYQWRGDELPDELRWNGTDKEGKPVPEGVYRFDFFGRDAARNTMQINIPGIRLVRRFEDIEFKIDGEHRFAPNNDGNLDTLAFTTRALNTTPISRLRKAKLEIIDIQGRTVRTIEKGRDDKIVWDGKTDDGKPAADGIYSARMSYDFDTGNLITATITNIVLDKTPPDYKITVVPDLFTPDGDSVNDTLFINLELYDPNKVVWEINIYKKGENFDEARPFKTFKGGDNFVQKVEKTIEWDGIGDNGLLVDSVQDYAMILTAKDGLGNTLRVERDIVVGVLLIERQYDWIIRVSSINFEFNKHNLTDDGRAVVAKVAEIIETVVKDPARYKLSDNYQIIIVGHTDSVGSASYNKPLSERRAKSVYDYLSEILKRKRVRFDFNRLSFKGVGFEQQLPRAGGETTSEYNARNRRVEFIIRK
jgi:outer membrane protein OmpA-like peptidoglycan-associated protein/flagellar hook assembly protein FlgD